MSARLGRCERDRRAALTGDRRRARQAGDVPGVGADLAQRAVGVQGDGLSHLRGGRSGHRRHRGVGRLGGAAGAHRHRGRATGRRADGDLVRRRGDAGERRGRPGQRPETIGRQRGQAAVLLLVGRARSDRQRAGVAIPGGPGHVDPVDKLHRLRGDRHVAGVDHLHGRA